MGQWFLTEAAHETEEIRQRTAWGLPGKTSQSNFGALLDIGSIHVSLNNKSDGDDEHEDDEDDEQDFIYFT